MTSIEYALLTGRAALALGAALGPVSDMVQALIARVAEALEPPRGAVCRGPICGKPATGHSVVAVAKHRARLRE